MARRGRHRDAKVAWLAAHPWWGELADDEIARIAALGDRLDLPSGRLLMHRGEPGVEAAMIIDGEVVVSRFGQVLAWLGPGEIVGELSVLDGVPRNADVRTASEVELLVFRAAELQTAMEEVDPLRARVMALAVAHRGGGASAPATRLAETAD
jgi:CRP/FNR family transcriptional regulator, cyclic AMP receptor protein